MLALAPQGKSLTQTPPILVLARYFNHRHVQRLGIVGASPFEGFGKQTGGLGSSPIKSFENTVSENTVLGKYIVFILKNMSSKENDLMSKLEKGI